MTFLVGKDKCIGNIRYNLLNLPEEVTFINGSSIKFFYSAEGEKLKVEYIIGGTTTNTCYCANVVYENDSQKYLLNDEGYYDLGGSNGGYHYYLKDHLGNNRVVINQSGAVQQTNHYYPYGGTFASSTTGTDNQPYKYNGKEYDIHAGLNWYDYGARFYDPAIARWTTQDPLAEKYYDLTSYGYCAGNPVILIDSEGKAIETVWDVASLTMVLKSLRDNIRLGNVGAAIADGVGVLLDAVAVATPFVPGGVSAAISAARIVDKVDDVVSTAKSVDNAVDAANVGKEGKVIVISIDDNNKISRDLLNPPTKRGHAPTFKSDNTPVEIHHEGQNSDGPFKEMHRNDHRGKENYKTNHPEYTNKSNIDRKQFNNARIKYWKYEYDNWIKRPNK